MCGIIGYVGSRECRDLLLQGLQRLEYRGYDSAGLSLVTNGAIDSVHAVGNLQHLRDAVAESNGHLRGSTGIGHTRWATHGRVTAGERAPALGHLGALPHRPERDRRELDRAARPPDRRGRRVHLRDRRRGGRPPDRACALRLATSSRPSASPTTSCAATTRSSPCRRTSRTCSSARARSARWSWASARARASSRPPSRRSCRRRAASSSCTTARSSAVTPQGSRFISPDGTEIERDVDHVDWNDEQAEKGGYETFMLKEIHEQADAVAETLAGRLGEAGWSSRTSGISDEFLKDVRRVVIVAVRHLVPRGPGGPLRDRVVVAAAGGDGHRLGVPLPQPGARRARPRDRHLAVRRDRRHAGRDAAGARARREGARDHEHPGQPGHARLGRRSVHARGPRDRRGRHRRRSWRRWRRCTCSR